MSISAWLTSHPAPIVIVESTDLVAGEGFSLVGAAAGVTWVVANGVSTAGPGLWADTRAPLGVPTVYTLAVGADQWTTTITRAAAATDLIASVNGRVSAAGYRDPDVGSTWSPRVSFFDVPDRYHPAWSATGTAGSPVSGVGLTTDIAGAASLRQLVETQRPVLLLHNEGHPGHRAGCAIERVRCVLVSAASDSLRRTAEPLIEWNLTVRDVAFPKAPIPVATWGEARALGWTWGSGLSWHQVRRAIALGLTQAQALEVTEPVVQPQSVYFDAAVFDPAVFQ